MIYHITSRQAWSKAQEQGGYRAASLETEGFIHCSTGTQLLPVLEKFYPGQPELILLVIDPSQLSSDLKWEPPSGGAPPPGVPEGDPFPHVYGPIDLKAVVRVFEVAAGSDGHYTLPALD